MEESASGPGRLRIPSVVAYLIILALVAGLYRFTALGLDDRVAASPCQQAICGAPIVLRRSPASPSHLLVPVLVEDRPMLFLLDTGASSTVLGLETARVLEGEIAVRPIVGAINASFQVQRVITIGSLRIGPHRFSDFDTVAVDLSTVQAALGSPIDGVLGANLIGALPFEIDFRSATLRLGRSATDFAAAAGPDEVETRVPVRELGGGYFVEVNADGRVGHFLVDSGSGTTQLSPEIASHLPSLGRHEALRFDATGAARMPVESVRVRALVMGDFARRSRSLDVAAPSLLGADFFAGTLLRIDPQQRELVIRYRPAEP